jgi:hypothetical protein
MRSRLLRRPYIRLALLCAVMFIARPVFAQPAPAQSGAVQARIDAAALALEKNSRFKGLSPQHYDEHGLDQARAHQIVCLMVGTGEEKYQRLAAATRLPKERQESCAADFGAATSSWDTALQPHLRRPDQPKTKIDVVYGEAKGEAKGGKLEAVAQALRSIMLLETVAGRMADTYAWPAPLAIEMQSCGYPNAQWLPKAHAGSHGQLL